MNEINSNFDIFESIENDNNSINEHNSENNNNSYNIDEEEDEEFSEEGRYIKPAKIEGKIDIKHLDFTYGTRRQRNMTFPETV